MIIIIDQLYHRFLSTVIVPELIRWSDLYCSMSGWILVNVQVFSVALIVIFNGKILITKPVNISYDTAPFCSLDKTCPCRPGKTSESVPILTGRPKAFRLELKQLEVKAKHFFIENNSQRRWDWISFFAQSLGKEFLYLKVYAEEVGVKKLRSMKISRSVERIS